MTSSVKREGVEMRPESPSGGGPADRSTGRSAVGSAGGAPFRIERIGDATLYLGDCRDILPTLGKVDAVVTDPPFGVRADTWDDMSEQEFARFTMRWLSDARLIASEMLVFCTADSAIRKLCEMIYPRVKPLIWHKPPGSQYPGGRERTRWYAYELVLHCFTPETWTVVEARDAAVGQALRRAREAEGMSRGGLEIRLRGKKTGLCYRWEEGACLPSPDDVRALRHVLDLDGDFDDALQAALATREHTKSRAAVAASENAAGRADVLSYRTVTAGRHPCEKPVPLMVDLLSESGGELHRVADPFMGSGSTGVAAAQLGRAFIGIEREPAYFDIACRRIEEAYRQPRLFEEPPPKPVQPSLLGDAA